MRIFSHTLKYTHMFIEKLKRIEELKSELDPIRNRIKSIEKTTRDSLTKINKTLSEYICSNLPDLDPDTKVSFEVEDTYNRIRVTNGESNGGWYSSEITIQLLGYDRFSLLRRDECELFNINKSTFSINGSSSNNGLENVQSLDTSIIIGFLSVELKKFGKNKVGSNVFVKLSEYLETYYNKHILTLMNVQSKTYPLDREIKDIEIEIKAIKKEISDGRVLEEIKANIGNRFESIDKVYPNIRSIKNSFGLSCAEITIGKINNKTVTIYAYGEKKFINKDVMIKGFKNIKRLYTEEEIKLMNRSNVISKLLKK